MDPLVLDRSSGRGSTEGSDENKTEVLSSYLSPSSSEQSGLPSTSDKSNSNSKPAPPPIQETIDSNSITQQRTSRRMPEDGIGIIPRGGRRKNDNDTVGTINSDSIPRVTPVNPFFNSSFYDDSDLSDGSLVFKSRQEQVISPIQHHVPTPRAGTHRGRDRFPSFDSVGSSGSVRYIGAPGNVVSGQKAPGMSQHNNPFMLPYHERRKLMRNKQMSQQGNVPLSSSDRVASEALPTPEQLSGMPPFPPSVAHPFPLHPYPSPDLGLFPPGAPQHFHPYSPYPGMAPVGHHPPPGPHPPHMMQMPHPSMPMFYPMPVNPDGTILYQIPPGMHHLPNTIPVSPRSRPPVSQKPPKSFPSTTLRPPVPTARDYNGSSFDTSDADELGIGSERAAEPPPPPPPATKPVSVSAVHVRQESTGSVSSLGSVDRDDSIRSRDFKRSGGSDLFAKLNPFQASPKPSKQHVVEEFHKKNQAFLATINNQSKSPASSVQSGGPRIPLSSMDRPPPSRGGHRRLHSIDNDDWEEGKSKNTTPETQNKSGQRLDYDTDDYSDMSDDEAESLERLLVGSSNVPDERTRLLPQSSGISSNEQYDAAGYGQRSIPGWNQNASGPGIVDYGKTMRADNNALPIVDPQSHKRDKKAKSKRRKDRRNKRNTHNSSNDSSESSSQTSTSSKDYQRWLKKRQRLLEKERAKLIKQWRAEARAEEEEERLRQEENRLDRRLARCLTNVCKGCIESVYSFLTWFEAFIGNLPLTIGAIALAIANLGVDWFKFSEESMNSCEPVHFHSAQCTFPEFPGCFYCDTDAKMYKIALGFHWSCNAIAAVLAFSFVAKLFLARRVVFDELSSPTTASPAGLICMTLDVVFAGRGVLGMLVVSLSSAIHLCISIWFIYMALAYHIMPEPSWFPNTTGIGISAVKTWLYYPMAGHFLMAISLALNFFFFPISLFRVAVNRKISATVGWMQMSAPNISLYALTIMAQPSFEEEHPDITSFQRIHRRVYMPLMHVLFALCILGMVASVSSLLTRWPEFRKVPFSPAHAAFCCPTLSHANAIQAYRAAINSFSTLPPDSPYRMFIYTYWIFFLFLGTSLTLVIAGKFLYSLPEWTHIDLSGEIEPPAPYETTLSLSNMIATGEVMIQPFVSPAILQANETGALVVTRDAQGYQRYVRTRKVTALGFEPMMNIVEMEREREVLLDWVGKNPPRRRHRTLSVPGIDFSYAQFGAGSGVYGMDEERASPWVARNGRKRANTYDPQGANRRFGSR